jgi:hypothetical protein
VPSSRYGPIFIRLSQSSRGRSEHDLARARSVTVLGGDHPTYPGRPYAASTGAGAPHPAQHLTDGAAPSVECCKLGHGKGALAVAPGPDLRHTANRCGGRSACITESRRSKAGSLWIGVEAVDWCGTCVPGGEPAASAGMAPSVLSTARYGSRSGMVTVKPGVSMGRASWGARNRDP